MKHTRTHAHTRTLSYTSTCPCCRDARICWRCCVWYFFCFVCFTLLLFVFFSVFSSHIVFLVLLFLLGLSFNQTRPIDWLTLLWNDCVRMVECIGNNFTVGTRDSCGWCCSVFIVFFRFVQVLFCFIFFLWELAFRFWILFLTPANVYRFVLAVRVVLACNQQVFDCGVS